jgi:hypothetical protein
MHSNATAEILERLSFALPQADIHALQYQRMHVAGK